MSIRGRTAPVARLTGEPAALPRGVRRALEAMRAEPGRRMTLADLAAIAGTPARTLQRQFQTFLAKAPLAALRDIRLECARRELLGGSPSDKVMDIALRSGFTHLGRFSAEYRERYGENPSRTLERGTASRPMQAPRPVVLAFTRPHDPPTLAVLPTEARIEDKAVGRAIAEALAMTLTRAGATLTTQAGSARYQLHSTFRGDGRKGRLTYRLIETATGRYIWAHQHDGATEDALLYEERVATQVAAAIQPGLRAAEIARARAKPDTDLSAYDLTLRAMPHATALEPEACARALDLLERALGLDPDYGLAVALAAWCHAQRVVFQFTQVPAEERVRALGLARRAMGLGGDATVLAVLGHAFTSAHDLEAADLVVRKALATDGGSAWAWSRSGWIDVYCGRPQSAIERFTIALELAPHDPLAPNGMVGLGNAHFATGRYDEAARWLEHAIAEQPSAAWAHRMLCPAYVLGGKNPQALRSLAAMRGAYPELTASQVTGAIPLPAPVRDRVADALETVGLKP